MKKSGRKLLGILLTASIAAATVFPMQGTAAEETDRGWKGEAQTESVTQEKISETEKETPAEGQVSKKTSKTGNEAGKPLDTVSANTVPAEEMDDSLIMPMSYDINQPVIESFELEENGKTLTKDDTLHFKMSAYDADGDISSITVQISRKNGYDNTQNVTFQKGEGNLYTGTFPCSRLTSYEGDYYVSKIRLEDRRNNYIEMATLDNGQPLYAFTVTVNDIGKVSVSDFQIQKNTSHTDGNLRVGDTVTYTAHAECEGVELKNNIWMYLKARKNSGWSSESVKMSYDANGQTLTGTYTVSDSTYPSEWVLDYIYVYAQNASYYFYPNKIEPDKNLKFTVVNDNYDTEKPVIESIAIDKNGEMVKAGETVTVKVKVNEKNPSSSMSIGLKPETSGISTSYVSLYLNSNTMEYTGSIRITRDSYPTKWELVYLSLSDKNGNSTSLTDFCPDWNTTRPWYYTVDPEGYLDDTEAPVIENITIDKNGQWVYPGDTVTITVKVNEKNPSTWAHAYFYPQVSYVSSSFGVDLYYHADTGEYVGAISITGDTYPCEWMLTDLYVSDIKGHYAYLSDYKPDWQDTCPWYYRVETEDTYREDVEDVTFSVYGLVPQESGGFQYGYWMDNETIKNVGRRSSLKELGILPPLPAGEVDVKWQQGWSGQEIDEDTELFFRGTSDLNYNFYATYDKSCVNVVLTYVSKDDGIKMAVVPQFVDREATYGDMLDSLVLPEDISEEFLVGYELDGSCAETAQVGDTVYVGVEAKYNDCLVAWDAKYLDKNGNVASKVIPKSYKRGTAISDALSVLEAPETPEGLEFERWSFYSIYGDDTISYGMTNLDVTAVYKGKTTADVSYTWRGEDGKIVSDSKLMLLDGENLSYANARNGIIENLKEVKHLKGLTLSGWEESSGIDAPGYKKLNLRAQYNECAVILRYPNNLWEYVVVEKDAPFTLPVESEKYEDILWEGYDKGETVTITEDREFLVSDAKLKDGTTEEPSGEKLSEEEIDKIVADIGQSGNGETIRIDMRKATIVPKEVLEAIRGKEVNIVLDMGAYSWSIGGNDVVATNLKDIDLEVIVDTHDIPPSIVDSLAEGKPATQITLIHDGEFGFRADLTVNLGSQHSGDTGNLYYYDSAGKLIFRDAGVIGADGSISLSFSHASEYVVIIDKKISEEGNQNSSDNGTLNNGQNGSGSETETITVAKMEGAAASVADMKKENDSGRPKSPKTGE